MTLRDLLNSVLDKGHISKVFEVLHTEYYSDQPKDEISHISCSYALVCRKLLELESNPGESDYQILVRQGPIDPENDEDDTIDTCLYNQEEDKTYAMDMTLWGELINMKVDTTVKLTDVHTLAHILWEITFYGFSEDKIRLAKDELEVLIERVESGEEKLYEWKDMESEFRNLTKDEDE